MPKKLSKSPQKTVLATALIASSPVIAGTTAYMHWNNPQAPYEELKQQASKAGHNINIPVAEKRIDKPMSTQSVLKTHPNYNPEVESLIQELESPITASVDGVPLAKTYPLDIDAEADTVVTQETITETAVIQDQHVETHRVVRGENLGSIAELWKEFMGGSFKERVSSLFETNETKFEGGNKNNLPVGTELIVPRNITAMATHMIDSVSDTIELTTDQVIEKLKAELAEKDIQIQQLKAEKEKLLTRLEAAEKNVAELLTGLGKKISKS